MSALGGIVQLLNNHAKYKSSFGLWHPIFLNQLLWSFETYEKDRIHISRRRKDTSGIPSWSWVSIHGEVVQLGGLSPKEIGYYGAELIQLPPTTSFEQISLLHRQLPPLVSTRLRSWATISEAVPASGSASRDLIHWGMVEVSEAQRCEVSAACQRSWDLYLNHPWTREQAKLEYRLDYLLLECQIDYPLLEYIYWPDEEPIQSEQLVCLLIKRNFSDDEIGGPRIREYSLVLKCVDARKSLYRRKGVYKRTLARPGAKHQVELMRARRSGNEDDIRKAQEEYEDCKEVLESRDEMRIRKLMIDRYSFFNEDEPKIEVEII
ncbi:hypothetical protein E8E13_006680 [Curvularia kusanoi]|uniref:Uncharacterized protein n=1 Tax=Curvularia kusanoi TaxID=90978 RepID=A0A9P4TF28_CURKU|nr:hypothetical protein E8E13_006680 [Curvularia kusanoi]